MGNEARYGFVVASDQQKLSLRPIIAKISTTNYSD